MSSSEWQPIETAPKDGTRILVAYSSRYPDSYVDILTYDASKPNGRTPWDYINSHMGEPVYWMPLPEAPKEGFHQTGCICDWCIERDNPDPFDDMPPDQPS